MTFLNDTLRSVTRLAGTLFWNRKELRPDFLEREVGGGRVSLKSDLKKIQWSMVF